MDNIHLNQEAKDKLIKGISKVADAVKVTLGAAGANAILEEGLYPFHMVTNDGVSVANKIKLEDPVENIGANIMKEAADRANKESGDGTTTCMVLTQAILQEGMKSKASPMDIKRSLDECLPLIHSAIDAQKKEITPNEVGAVAAISAESESLGALFQEMYKIVGKNGIVELDVANVPETYYEIKEGVRLRNAGFMYPYMANDAKGKSSTYLNPKILITKEKLATVPQVDSFIKAFHQAGVNELVIFCDEIDVKVSEYLAMGHMQGVFKTLVIKAPTLWKDWLYEDFAKITGATIVDSTTGTSLKKLQLSWLGTCEKIISNKDETTVIGIKDISDHIASLEEEGTDDSKLRLAWLQTKAAVLKLGANSESELSYIRLKAEDARNAAYLALQDGVVVGGGVALLNVISSLRNNPELLNIKMDIESGKITKPSTIGLDILYKALQAPFIQICENAGVKVNHQIENEEWSEGIIESINLTTLKKDHGFNAKTREIVNMWDAQILDPSLVVKNAIKNAISIAGTVLTAKVVITQPK